MNFAEQEITIKPGHDSRTWQSCDYLARGVSLFQERTYFPRGFLPGACRVSCWMPGSGTHAEIKAQARRHGGRAEIEPYAPDGADRYFLAFDSTDRALAFCRTPDFDRLCRTFAKI